MKARTVIVAVGLVVAGALAGIGGLILLGHYAPSSGGMSPFVIYRSTIIGNNTSLGGQGAGNFTVPGSSGHEAVLLIQMQANVSADLLAGMVTVTLSNHVQVADTAPAINGPGVTILAPVGGLIALVAVSGTPFVRGVAFSATTEITDEGTVSTS